MNNSKGYLMIIDLAAIGGKLSVPTSSNPTVYTYPDQGSQMVLIFVKC
jgi:hypothetical protein